MKSMFANRMGNVVQVDRRYVQLIALLVTLLLFVLGGGAPLDSFACGGC
jgi:hypothetical protein